MFTNLTGVGNIEVSAFQRLWTVVVQKFFADVGDVTTLANLEIVEDIRHHVHSEKVARGEVPRELSPQELEEIVRFGGAE